MFELTSINIEAWLSSLSIDQLNDLAKAVDSQEAQKTLMLFIKLKNMKITWDYLSSNPNAIHILGNYSSGKLELVIRKSRFEASPTRPSGSTAVSSPRWNG